MSRIHKDAFNLLAGKLLGEGVHRKVFSCKLRDDLVMKVEQDADYRSFHNVQEWLFWNANRDYTAVARWLAPIEYVSPDGFILLQKKVHMIQDRSVLPGRLPAFLTDTKYGNFGWLDKKLVCVDYALTITNPSVKTRKADWWD